MRMMVTGSRSNLGRGVITRLRNIGHDLVLTDVTRPSVEGGLSDLRFVEADLEAGPDLSPEMAGCDLIVHLPAKHRFNAPAAKLPGLWRLNVDGLFGVLQSAAAAGVDRMVFLSSMAWHDHYGDYGFTKRIGEERCEDFRRHHGLRYISVRPASFTPRTDYVNGYGARLL